MIEKRRNCCAVIGEMILKVPITEVEFIKDLKWNLEDASYKAPEQTIQWIRTQETLIKHLPNPNEDWQFNVISIFTTQSVEELKNSFK